MDPRGEPTAAILLNSIKMTPNDSLLPTHTPSSEKLILAQDGALHKDPQLVTCRE